MHGITHKYSFVILWLKEQLKEVALHKSFLLQGGDCAESFSACTSELIDSKLKVILQMILGLDIPVVKIARIAGQFTKPRSKLTEIINGKEVLSFRGESVNSYATDERQPDPERLVAAYFHSSATLNYIRSLSSSKESGSDFSFLEKKYVKNDKFINTQVFDTLNFKHINKTNNNFPLNRPDIFTSHEGLLLEYEECMTRKIKDLTTNEIKWWNLGTHFLWIGDRTRNIDGAHLEYFRGIENPIEITTP
ncbi:hypothetical protein PCK2_000863, partial [Pneumocystis canis]